MGVVGTTVKFVPYERDKEGQISNVDPQEYQKTREDKTCHSVFLPDLGETLPLSVQK